MLRPSRGEHETGGAVAGVLLVTYDEDAGELLARLLERAGYLVHRATGEAATVARVASDGIGCVVIDIGGAHAGTSVPLLDELRSHPDPAVAEVRVVMLASPGQRRPSPWQADVDALLVRPFHADAFLREVAEPQADPDAGDTRTNRA